MQRDSLTVIGMGKLGLATAACLASKGYKVIGVDINESVVEAINKGESPLYEPGLAELMQKVKGKFNKMKSGFSKKFSGLKNKMKSSFGYKKKYAKIGGWIKKEVEREMKISKSISGTGINKLNNKITGAWKSI